MASGSCDQAHGFVGVYRIPGRTLRPFRAKVTVRAITIHAGFYSTAEAAAGAVNVAKLALTDAGVSWRQGQRMNVVPEVAPEVAHAVRELVRARVEEAQAMFGVAAWTSRYLRRRAPRQYSGVVMLEDTAPLPRIRTQLLVYGAVVHGGYHPSVEAAASAANVVRRVLLDMGLPVRRPVNPVPELPPRVVLCVENLVRARVADLCQSPAWTARVAASGKLSPEQMRALGATC
jgi:hypothetical protein